jgi:hypothetical protein
VTLTKRQAEDLTGRICTVLDEDLMPLVIEAYQGGAAAALDYGPGDAGWKRYCGARFGGALTLTAARRKEAIAELTASGMSTRATAAAVGVDHSTVVRQGQQDRSPGANAPGEDEAPPVRSKGLDGKSYPAKKPKVVDEEIVDAEVVDEGPSVGEWIADETTPEQRARQVVLYRIDNVIAELETLDYSQGNPAHRNLWREKLEAIIAEHLTPSEEKE